MQKNRDKKQHIKKIADNGLARITPDNRLVDTVIKDMEFQYEEYSYQRNQRIFEPYPQQKINQDQIQHRHCEKYTEEMLIAKVPSYGCQHSYKSRQTHTVLSVNISTENTSFEKG